MSDLQRDEKFLHDFSQQLLASPAWTDRSQEMNRARGILASVLKRLYNAIYYARLLKQNAVMYLSTSSHCAVTLHHLGENHCQYYREVFMSHPFGIMAEPPRGDRMKLVDFLFSELQVRRGDTPLTPPRGENPPSTDDLSHGGVWGGYPPFRVVAIAGGGDRIESTVR